jgi:hypothetical protein
VWGVDKTPPFMYHNKKIQILMNIKLWYCESMKQWRWTLTDSSQPIRKQESGQRPFLRDAMNDIATTVEYMLESGHPD